MSAGPSTRVGRGAGAILAALCALGLARVYRGATDFPREDPRSVVDAELIAHLRAHPGLHLALAPDYRLEVPLELVEDTSNRAIFGTEVDLREPVPRRAIHIQRQGELLAIHADNYNPKAGLVSALIHGTLDVPVVPLALGLLAGLGLAFRRARPTSQAVPS